VASNDLGSPRVHRSDSKELLRLFIEYTPVAVALLDKNMCYLAYSRRWITDFDLEEDDLIGRCHYDVFPEIPPQWKEEHERCLAGETIKKPEERFPRKDGSTDWVRRELHPWYDRGGKVGGIIIFAEVITERKKEQEAQRKSEEKFYKLFHANPHGITLSTLTEGRYLEVNQAFLDQIGWEKHEIIGRTSLDIGLWDNPNDRERAKEIIEEKGFLRNFHVNFRRKSGDIYPCEWSCEVIELEGIRCILSVVTDISERTKIERALRESEKKYRIIVENANDAIFIAQDGVIKFPNPKTQELVNVPAQELENASFAQFIHPEDRQRVIENYEKTLKGEKLPSTYTFRVIRDPDEVRTVEISAVLTEWGGRPATLNFLRDITEQKKLEAQLQQAQRMEAIGTLAGGIAHDFNNLLMGIQGNASLILLDLPPDHPLGERVRDIQESVRRGAELTRQLLGFARGGKYHVEPTDINTLVHETVELFGRTKKEIKIYEKYQKDVWAVEVDQTQIDQVLLNILVNAWQAMPKGGDIYIETENIVLSEEYVRGHEAQTGPYVKISVTDTGIGMDEKTVTRIFDPFFTTKELGRGTGLGLSSAYGIIKNHGGFITVYSEPGKGSAFNIYLPAAKSRVLKEGNVLSPDVERGSGTILLVDDEETVLRVGVKMLQALGYDVLEATNGQEAIEIFRENSNRIDLVVLDMVMPGMGGGEVFDAIKVTKPEVKILLSSGYSQNGQAQEILARGCNGFIQKPFDMVRLSQALKQILSHQDT